MQRLLAHIGRNRCLVVHECGTTTQSTTDYHAAPNFTGDASMSGAPTLPGTIRVLERGWLSSNNILLYGAHGVAVVDTGYVTHAAQTLSLIQHALDGQRLDLIVNTHLHSDHCGGNAILRQHYRCDIAIPLAEADKVSRWDQEGLGFRATGQCCDRFEFQRTLTPGQSLELGKLMWEVLAAPGHNPHALILYCRTERILITADALWENGFGVIFPELFGESGFAEQQAVLDLIASLDVDIVIPGHGAPFADVAGALERAFSRLAYLRADPRRNASNALKVLIVFKLLEMRSMSYAELDAFIDSSSIVQSCLLMLNAQRSTVLKDTLAALERGGALRIVGHQEGDRIEAC